MNIVQITAASICISVLVLAVKNMRSDIGQLLSIGAVTVVMACIVPYVIKVILSMKEFASYSELGNSFLVPVLKITGIAYISQIGSELCVDSGETALAGRVEAAGKIAISVISLPIAKEAFTKIMEILA